MLKVGLRGNGGLFSYISSMNEDSSTAAYWNAQYESRQTNWDIGHVSPPLKDYIDQLTNKDLAILIPGCGNSYEAAYLLQQGFTNITVVDFAPLLTAKLAEKFKSFTPHPLTIITSDFFNIEGQYDLILEQTFFCTLPPARRTDYVHKTFNLLKPGGKLAGVLFNRSFEENPPFGGSLEEYQPLFSQVYHLKTLAPCYNSIKPRMGSEVFLVARKSLI
jgi:SAM-dependent methyltransferase